MYCTLWNAEPKQWMRSERLVCNYVSYNIKYFFDGWLLGSKKKTGCMLQNWAYEILIVQTGPKANTLLEALGIAF